MKQKDGYVIKTIANVPYLIPYGQNIADHKHGVQLNQTGVFLWNALQQEQTEDDLLNKLQQHYHTAQEDMNEMKKDLEMFLNQLSGLGLIDTGNTSVNNTPYKYLKIGGLYLELSGNPDAFSKELDAFEIPKCPHIDMKIDVLTSSPENTGNGTLLLRNKELFICERETDYLFLFPSSRQILEAHLEKDGSSASFYCLPPFTPQLVNDLFHAIRLVYLYRAQKSNLFALHSASILYKGKAWLFSGPSGTGKSTHTNLWKEQFHTPVINGDLNLIKLAGNEATVCGMPWCGTSGIADSKTYPLGGIILLKQGETNYLEKLTPDKKTLYVMQRFISPAWTKELLEQNLDIAERLAGLVYIGRLFCTKDMSAAHFMKEEIDKQIFLR